MLFLFVLVTLLVVALVSLIGILIRSFSNFPVRELPLLMGFLTGAAALLLLIDFLGLGTVRGDARNLAPSFLFASGLLFAWTFATRAVALGRSLKASRTKTMSASFGVSFVALLASTYLVVTTIDHWRFFSGPEDGVVDLHGIAVPGVPCVVAVVHVRHDDVAYRCPTSAIFSIRYADPFVPWPEYQSGRSRLLKQKLDEIDHQARPGS